MRNIAVMTGAAGAGKTTIAKYLVEQGYERVRFAEALKGMAAAMGLNEREIDGDLKEVPCPKLTFELIMSAFEGARLHNAFRAILPEYDSISGYATVELFGGHTLVYAMTSFMHVVLACVAKGSAQGATPRSLMQMIGTDWGRRMIREDLWVSIWRDRIAQAGDNVVIDDCRFPNELDECKAHGDTLVFRIERDGPSVLTGETEKAHESEAHRLPHDHLVENNSTPADAGEAVRHLVWHLDWHRRHPVSADFQALCAQDVGSGA